MRCSCNCPVDIVNKLICFELTNIPILSTYLFTLWQIPRCIYIHTDCGTSFPNLLLKSIMELSNQIVHLFA